MFAVESHSIAPILNAFGREKPTHTASCLSFSVDRTRSPTLSGNERQHKASPLQSTNLCFGRRPAGNRDTKQVPGDCGRSLKKEKKKRRENHCLCVCCWCLC